MNVSKNRITGKRSLLAFVMYFAMGFLQYYKPLLSENPVIAGAPTCYFSFRSFISMIASPFTWSEKLSIPTKGPSIFSLETILSCALTPLSVILDLHPSKIVVMENVLATAFAGFTMYLLTQELLRKSIDNYREVISFLSSTMAGLIYIMNLTVFLHYSIYTGIKLAYSIFPLFVLFLIKTFHEKKFRELIITGLLWVIVGETAPRWFVGIVLFIGIFSLYHIILRILEAKTSIKREIPHMLKLVFLLVAIVVPLYSHYLIAFFTAKSDVSMTALTTDLIRVRFANVNALTLFTGRTLALIPPLYDLKEDLLTSIRLLISAFMVGLAVIKRNKYVAFFSMLLVVSFLLGGAIFPEFHRWLVLYSPSPIKSLVGRAFSSIRLVEQYAWLSISVLAAFSFYYVMNKLYCIDRGKILLKLFILSFIVLSTLSSWPIFTGDMGGKFAPTNIPKEIEDLLEWLARNDSYSKVIYVPEYYGIFQPYWRSNQPLDNFFEVASTRPTYFRRNNIFVHYGKYLVSLRYDSLLIRNQTEVLSDFLKALNIKYLILHNDIHQLSKRVKDSISFLNNSQRFKLVKNYGFIYVYENRKHTSQFFHSF